MTVFCGQALSEFGTNFDSVWFITTSPLLNLWKNFIRWCMKVLTQCGYRRLWTMRSNTDWSTRAFSFTFCTHSSTPTPRVASRALAPRSPSAPRSWKALLPTWTTKNKKRSLRKCHMHVHVWSLWQASRCSAIALKWGWKRWTWLEIWILAPSTPSLSLWSRQSTRPRWRHLSTTLRTSTIWRKT